MTNAGAVPIRVVVDSLGAGGTERSLAEMLPGLRASGFDMRITTLIRRYEGFHDEVEGRGVRVQVLRSRSRLGRVAELRRQLRMEGPALVHTMLFEADIAGRLAAAGTGIPVLSSLVSVAYDPARSRDPHVRRMRLRAARAIDGWTARRLTEHFHALTETVKESVVTVLRIPPERVTVVRRGRDPIAFGEPGPERRRQVRGRLGIPDDALVVIAVGRQEYVKGHDHLFEALAPLLREHPRLVGLVVGRVGAHTARLEERHRSLGLGDRVRLLGHRPDVPDLLAASDVFAFPSLYEGFGGSALEAMALGLPVVCSDLPPLRELVEADRTALVVPPGSPGPLRAALERLLTDGELRRRLGERGRRVFLERFTLARSVEGMAALYGRLIEVGRPSEVVG